MVSNWWEAWGWVGVGVRAAMAGTPPQIEWIVVTPASGWAQGRAMPMTLAYAYAIALADARSCLAALADAATDFDESVQFEHLLLALDALHPDGPALYAVAGDRGALFDRLDVAVDRMLALGGDLLSLEFLAALAHGTIRAN